MTQAPPITLEASGVILVDSPSQVSHPVAAGWKGVGADGTQELPSFFLLVFFLWIPNTFSGFL